MPSSNQTLRFFIDDGKYDWNEVESTKGQFRFETPNWNEVSDGDPKRPCPYSDAFEDLEAAVEAAVEFFRDDRSNERVLVCTMPDGSTRQIDLNV